VTAEPFLHARLAGHGGAPALAGPSGTVSHADLRGLVERWDGRLAEAGVGPGAVVALEAEFGPESVAALVALIGRAAIVVPLSSSVESAKPTSRAVAEVEWRIVVDGPAARAAVTIEPTGVVATHEHHRTLRDRGHAGLVLFSSGSTGVAKAAVHDFTPLLRKFELRRPALRTMAFLLFDHIGGVNTLLHTIANGGCLVTVADRAPDAVAAGIAAHGVEVLPTSPTFLNLLLLSEAHRRHDVSSLRLVTYGTEPMPASLLARLGRELPGVRLQQTYGLSELGILRSKSRADDSLWMRIGGEGFAWRVADGLLEIRAESAMLGYLNAPSPFTDDGWFRTGDAVEVDGDWLRVLGRRSELINVGGEKVYPAEVESVLLSIPGVEDAAIVGEPHPLTGAIVTARVRLTSGESLAEFRARMRGHCRGRLEPFKIPQKVVLVDEPLGGERFKKVRR
jgi:long-chain acyl-CoA synthetase